MSATSVGKIGLDLVVNQKQFNMQMSGIKGLAAKAGAALASAFAVKKVVDFGKKCMDLGSDLQEVQNVVDTTFTSMSSKVDKFAQSAAGSFGLSETMAKKFTGTFGAMSKAFGFSEQEAYKMSTTLTGLAGDIASFYNITQDEAYTKLKSVFTGETESLKDLGVVMTQTALDSYALANGFGKTTSAMTEAEKVALRYQFVQSQLSAAAGDFAKTSGSWANQCRILSLQIESIMATVGQGLINLFTPIIRIINTVIGKLATLANAFKSFTELITGNKSTGDSVSNLNTAATSAADGFTGATNAANNLSNATSSVDNAAKKAVKNMRALMGFDVIQKIPEQEKETSNSLPAGSASSVGSAIDFGSLAKGETTIEKLDSKFEGLFENLKKNLAPLTIQLERFGSIAKGAFSWLLENVLKPLANFTITEVVPRFFQTLANVMEIVNNVLIALKPTWKWFWENVLKPIGTWTAKVFLKTWDKINGALSKFAKWCAENPKTIQKVVTAVASFFAAFKFTELISKITGFIKTIGGISGVMKTVGGLAAKLFSNPIALAIAAVVAAGVLVWQNWDTIKEKAKEIWGSITSYLSSVWSGIKQTAVTVFDGIRNSISTSWNNLKNATSTAWNSIKSSLSTAWANIKQSAMTTFNGVKTSVSTTWNTVKSNTSSIWSGIKNTLSSAWTNIKSKATSSFDGIKTTANNAWTSIQQKASSAWTSVSTKVGGVLTGIGTKATQMGTSIRNAFVNAFKGIVNLIKGPVNSVIGFINGMIRGVVGGINTILRAFNKLKIDIPDWVPVYGGKTLGFNFRMMTAPQIPYLAKGAFVEKNTPQLAVIGDNRHQGELVAPEDKLRQMAIDAVRAAGGAHGITREELETIMNNAVMRIIAALASVGFNLDGEQIAKLQRVAQASIDRRYNTTEII